jgi:hypothetical protein
MSPKPHDHQIIHSSEESDWRTPDALVSALLDEEYGGIEIDLAADSRSRKLPIWLGPGSPHGEDALAVDWGELLRRLHLARVGFLNPPFSRTKARELKAAGDPRWRAYTVEAWAEKCWRESRDGFTIYAVLPFAPQTEWYRKYVCGHDGAKPLDQVVVGWNGHAAEQERRLPHRISFLRPDGSAAENAGVNSVIIKWGPATGIVGPWQPHSFYWSYR